ncbi:protein kinase domain-containing protein [Lyngbya aestuarii]|uniref:protein kinase domain-containing protein n=1 Tax=Lyngbya aestuarii TaxID=118322 RepID=UPI00403E115C
MNFPGNLYSFRPEVLQNTQLGQLCGQEQLFRDRYQVLRMIGRGGFGLTFLARDVSLPGNPLCVIKQLCPKVNDPPALEKARVRFKREAETLVKLGNHSQIPMLLDYFVADGEFYLVQEYVNGSTLARLVRRYGCVSETAVKSFLREMLPLLQYVHENQVIHRDIKPQNIIRCQDDGRLVLIDFGAVKEVITPAGDSSGKMPTTHFIGTVGFAPPEQFYLRPVFGSDLYSLGVTCLYLLTGKAPLEFKSDLKNGELRWQDTANVSESLAKILGKMLKVSLQERYQSAQAILRALESELHQDNLAECLCVRHQPDFYEAASKNKSKPGSHRSPAAQTAVAIRDWKNRRQEKQRLRRRSKISNLLNKSGNSS